MSYAEILGENKLNIQHQSLRLGYRGTLNPARIPTAF
jgi:hypothetical protein